MGRVLGRVLGRVCICVCTGAGINTSHYAIQPIAMHPRIAIEQQHVTFGVKRDRAIASRYEPQILRVGEHRNVDTWARCQARQKLRHTRLRACVVDDDQFIRRGAGICQHAVNTGFGLGQPAVHGNDNVDGFQLSFVVDA